MSDTSTTATQADPIGAFVAEYDSGFSYNAWPKRIIDIALSLLILPILVPIIAVLYFVVRSDGGPGFFGHTRVGRGGRLFRCWKLRTMVPDAQQRLEELLARDPAAREEWNRDQKLTNDPRITRYGEFLRKTSLDELPQILNVLRGEMSLVGPRPVTEPELERYGSRKAIYMKLRPGVTGLWQVSGRNEVTYDERVAMDVTYYKSMSMVSDVGILFRTVGAVMKKTGR